MKIASRQCGITLWSAFRIGGRIFHLSFLEDWNEKTLTHTPRIAVKENEVAATCTIDGSYDEVVYCKNCTYEFSRENKTVLSGHKYVDGRCEVCKELKPSKGLEFSLSRDGTYYSVIGIGTCTDKDIVVPSQYESLPVKITGDRAFEFCTSPTSIEIPDSVTSIGSEAFLDCSSLTNVYYKGTAEEWMQQIFLS